MSVYLPLLKTALAENAITHTDAKAAQWAAYLEALVTWNKVFNLTSVTDARDMVYLHIIDSLLIAPFLQGQRCLDVGSGAGLPGIPLAILHPEQSWTLLDKNSKKTRFMIQVSAELGLKNVNVIHHRSEDFQPTNKFDSILSRAYGSLAMFVETTEHLLSPEGILIAMKGKWPEDEIEALPRHWTALPPVPLTMKGMSIERHIVCMKKRA